ncbi:MAG: flavin reductase, partial [Gammaproteobacteria bacterium]|nr:flavin reductase [Gammaproteobacteria bacterium]
LIGRYTPTVRQPVCEVSTGKYILGIGDTVVLNDPVTGQGANNACYAAKIYFDRIQANQNQPFDRNWMQDTFDIFWKSYGYYSWTWTNTLLNGLPDQIIELFTHAQHNQYLANTVVNGCAQPSLLFPWIESDANIKQLMQSCALT